MLLIAEVVFLILLLALFSAILGGAQLVVEHALCIMTFQAHSDLVKNQNSNGSTNNLICFQEICVFLAHNQV